MIGTASAGDGAAAAAAEAQESGGTSGGSGGTAGTIPGAGGGFSEEDKARMEDEGERAGGVGIGGGGGGGNRWPRQETLALLKIRSDMDVVFRETSLKGPLWEQVSRKMADLGYHRSAKKCKEKFENVYKYHKRTKEGRSTKPEGKTYRFFDQLAALENSSSSSSAQMSAPPPRPQAPPMVSPPGPMQAITSTHNPPIVAQHTVSSATNNDVSGPHQSFNNFINSSFPPTQTIVLPQPNTAANVSNPPQGGIVPPSHQTFSTSLLSNSPSSSSSTSSDEDIERRHKRKRKWKDFFERLMKDVINKQEELQKRFLETLEKRERDRMIREEAWRVQEMARINREHDLLVQERSMAAARESALVTFLKKMNPNPNSTNAPLFQIPLQQNLLPPQPPPTVASTPATTTPVVVAPSPAPAPAPAPAPPPQIRPVQNTPKSDNGGENFMGTSSSRWPKAEVEALIQLRTSLDNKYQENTPKGPLWEDISSGMKRIGYNRSAKRCKEKWENINKYFKKVKESNKKRPEDSKTCPYFQQLEALYKEKAKTDASSYSTGYVNAVKPENPMIPIMARPEQQWPLPQDHQQQQQHQQLQDSAMDEHEDDNIDQNDHDDDDDDDGDDDEEDEGSGYEIVTNKPSSVATTVQ